MQNIINQPMMGNRICLTMILKYMDSISKLGLTECEVRILSDRMQGLMLSPEAEAQVPTLLDKVKALETQAKLNALVQMHDNRRN